MVGEEAFSQWVPPVQGEIIELIAVATETLFIVG